MIKMLCDVGQLGPASMSPMAKGIDAYKVI